MANRLTTRVGECAVGARCVRPSDTGQGRAGQGRAGQVRVGQYRARAKQVPINQLPPGR